MENKHNFTGIIIPVIVAVILLTVLPIINSINGECPPCEVCPSYNIGNLEVNPIFSSGNYIIDKNDYDYLDNVTIIKDNNLIPENIKKGVNIFGIDGTLETIGAELVLHETSFGSSITISAEDYPRIGTEFLLQVEFGSSGDDKHSLTLDRLSLYSIIASAAMGSPTTIHPLRTIPDGFPITITYDNTVTITVLEYDIDTWAVTLKFEVDFIESDINVYFYSWDAERWS